MSTFVSWLPWIGCVVGTLLLSYCAMWLVFILAARRDRRSAARVLDRLVAPEESGDGVGVRIAEHFGTTERVLWPPAPGISGDPAYGCEERWEAELFDDPDFALQARLFGIRRVNR